MWPGVIAENELKAICGGEGVGWVELENPGKGMDGQRAATKCQVKANNVSCC